MIGVVVVLGVIAAVVLVPLAREYADLRRSFGLGRAAAAGTTLLVLPALGCGLAAALPIGSHPAAQWTVAVVVALAVYSLAASAVRSTLAPAAARSRR